MQGRERGLGSVLWLLVLIGGCVVQRAECKHDSQFDKIIDGLPPGFVFGSASAAYQVGTEGRGLRLGRGWWLELCGVCAIGLQTFCTLEVHMR